MAECEQEVFLPEEVDEQIDEYLAYAPTHKQAPDPAAEQAVQALQHHLAPAEEDAALQRVWQRFEQERSTMHRRKTAHTGIIAPLKRRYPVSSLHTYKEGRSAVTHRLNLAAAVIFVVLLVGSMAFLFRLAPNRHTNVSSTPREKMMFVMTNRTLYRLDMKTHQPLWHIDGTVQLGQLVGDTYYVNTMKNNQESLNAVDASSGKVRWQVALINWMGQLMISSNTVYFPTQAKNGDVTVIALNSTNGVKKWEDQLKNNNAGVGATSSFDTGRVIFLTAVSDKAMYGETVERRNNKAFWQHIALNAQDGKQLWQKDDGFAGQNPIMQGKIADGVLSKIQVEQGASEKGYFRGYDAATGKQIWSKVLWSKALDNGISIADMTLLNDVVYITTIVHNQGNSFYAFSAKDGTQLWHNQDASSSDASSPTVTEHDIYFNRYAGQTLVALDTATGKVRWTYNFHDNLTVEYPPAADNDRVYLSLPNNVIQMLRASDGKPLGTFKVSGKVDPNNRVIVQVV